MLAKVPVSEGRSQWAIMAEGGGGMACDWVTTR